MDAANQRVMTRAETIAKQVIVERLAMHEPPRPAVSSRDEHLAAICQRRALEERLYRIGKMREARA